jgi:hypothetical protein
VLAQTASDDARAVDGHAPIRGSAQTGDSLPAPFSQVEWGVDRATLLTGAQARAADQLAEIGASPSYAARLPWIAERVAFLAPFEFLVVSCYGRAPETRDRLLALYRDDPRRALHEIAEIWPSPRAELQIQVPAYYDLDADQIFVNTARVAPEMAPRVVVHEMWHALADLRPGQLPDGTPARSSGFWTQVKIDGGRSWRPLDERLDDGVPTFLMNEALAVTMEVDATGLQHQGLYPELTAAIDALQRLIDVEGRDEVLRLYLASRSDQLKLVARAAA